MIGARLTVVKLVDYALYDLNRLCPTQHFLPEIHYDC